MIHDHDLDEWELWEKYPKYHKWWNKLYLSQVMGYSCGPCGTKIPKTSEYVIRPIYNLAGMGIGAEVKVLEKNDLSSVQPGYFWCEYFEGTHYSIDYKRTNQPKGSVWVWEPFCTMVGEKEENNLTKFTKWTVVDSPKWNLPRFICEIDDVEFLNVECIDDKIFEIHLRTGNDVLHGKSIGSVAIPIWEGEEDKLKILEEQGYTFKGNHHPESFKYSAHGLLSDLRIGYMIK